MYICICMYLIDLHGIISMQSVKTHYYTSIKIIKVWYVCFHGPIGLHFLGGPAGTCIRTWQLGVSHDFRKPTILMLMVQSPFIAIFCGQTPWVFWDSLAAVEGPLSARAAELLDPRGVPCGAAARVQAPAQDGFRKGGGAGLAEELGKRKAKWGQIQWLTIIFQSKWQAWDIQPVDKTKVEP